MIRAIQAEEVKLPLVEQDANKEATDKDETPPHWAALKGSKKAARSLIEKGANRDTINWIQEIKMV